MSTIQSTLTDDHDHCDDLFAEAENQVANARSASDWQQSKNLFDRFHSATLLHLAREEQALFPAFEAASGMPGGPTYVMRHEHAQMRDTLNAMAHALAEEDRDGYLGQSETLLMLMRQHNMKEEQMLYRMCDQVLAGERDALLERMALMTD